MEMVKVTVNRFCKLLAFVYQHIFLAFTGDHSPRLFFEVSGHLIHDHLIEQTYFFNHSEVFNIGGVVNLSDIKIANFTLTFKFKIFLFSLAKY
jgi:hypothetical protein